MAIEAKSSGNDSAFRSDHQRIGDRTGFADETTHGAMAKRDLTDKASEVVHDAAHKAKDMGDRMMETASDVGHSIQETGHNVAEKAKHAHQAICDFTRENPTAAMLMAFGLGAILARVLPGR